MPYISPYANNIAALISREGEARARAIEGASQAWMHGLDTVAQAGTNIANTLVQAPIRQQEMEARGLEISNMKRQAATAQLVDTTKQRISTLMNDPTVMNEDGTFNVKALSGKLGAPTPMRAGEAGPTQATPFDADTLTKTIEPINKSILDARNSALEFQNLKTVALANLARGALTMGAADGKYFEHASTALGAANKSGLLSDDELHSTLTSLVEHQEQTPQILQGFIKRLPPNLKDVPRGGTLIDANDIDLATGKARVVATGSPEPITRPELALRAGRVGKPDEQPGDKEAKDALATYGGNEPLEVTIGAGGKRIYTKRSDAIGKEAPAPDEPLVPVLQADGSVLYQTRAQAQGKPAPRPPEGQAQATTTLREAESWHQNQLGTLEERKRKAGQPEFDASTGTWTTSPLMTDAQYQAERQRIEAGYDALKSVATTAVPGGARAATPAAAATAPPAKAPVAPKPSDSVPKPVYDAISNAWTKGGKKDAIYKLTDGTSWKVKDGVITSVEPKP